MIKAVFFLTASLKSMFRDRTELALENLALRQQLAIFARTRPHSRLRWTDRLFWAWLSQVWHRWRECLIVVKPDTVIRSSFERCCSALFRYSEVCSISGAIIGKTPKKRIQS